VSSLILVKHSAPNILTSVPAPSWHLSLTGIARCAALADRLHGFRTRSIASSVEPKAVETATLVGERLGLSVDLVEGLQEHDRRDTRLLGADQFEGAMRSLFAHPHDLVFGQETATAALRRFDAAIGDLLASRGSAEDVIVVSHGTVISLFVAVHTGTDGFALWSRLGLPSLVVLRRSDLSVERVEATLSEPRRLSRRAGRPPR